MKKDRAGNGRLERALSPTEDRQLWERSLAPLLGSRTESLWRQHSDAVNHATLVRWLPEQACDHLLKTDLYDEAMGAGLYPLLAKRATHVAAVDIAPSVLAAAKLRYPGLSVAAADVRKLPFADDAFDVVVSNSTLDHFAERADILVALRGLHRVLRPGGRLLLTLDNLANPAVALRNALPAPLLRRIGLTPYPVGATLGPWRLRRVLGAAGFDVLDVAAILHCPRALTVAQARKLERRGTPEDQRRFLRAAARWEWLARWPTRFHTAYFIGISAQKL